MAKANIHVFSDNLQYLMNRNGITLQQLAAELDIHPSRARAWLDGRCYPKHSVMILLCEYFDYLDIYTLITSPLKKSYETITRSH